MIRRFQSPEILQSLSLFANLPKEDLAPLAANNHLRCHQAGELVFFEGDPAIETLVAARGK
ncbi:MAG: hypothetical protein WA116_05620 [Anaerolineaceae bacterium]